jgi:hypothetical protein
VELQRELAVGALQFDFCDRAGYAQYLVIIAFCVGGQGKVFLLEEMH